MIAKRSLSSFCRAKLGTDHSFEIRAAANCGKMEIIMKTTDTCAKSTSKAKKIANTVINILMYMFFAVCIFALILSMVSKKDADGAMSLFGMQARIVISDSMAKHELTDVSDYKIKDIPIKSMIFIELVPEDPEEAEKWYSELKRGDVLTFRYFYVTQETITHRIVEDPVKNENGGYTILLEGDNKASDIDTLAQTIDTSLDDSPNYVIGKVTGQSRLLGLLISAVKSPVGIILIVMVPCIVIAIFEIIRIVGVIGDGKRRKADAEAAAKEAELLELRRKLMELEAKNSEEKQDGE